MILIYYSLLTVPLELNIVHLLKLRCAKAKFAEAKLAKAEAERLGISQRDNTDDEIIERLMYSMINEGALILGEGIASKSSDIDVVFVHGYGMPRYRGGPMCYADEIGLDKVIAGMEKYKARYGDMYKNNVYVT